MCKRKLLERIQASRHEAQGEAPCSELRSQGEGMSWYKSAQSGHRGSHRAPGKEGARADDLTMNGVYPADVYTRPDWYESGEGLQEMHKIMRLRGRPDGFAWIFRAVPSDIAGPLEGRVSRLITPGDWVTTNKKYAQEHGDSALNGEYVVVARRVRARDIYTEGNSIFEWGYNP